MGLINIIILGIITVLIIGITIWVNFDEDRIDILKRVGISISACAVVWVICYVALTHTESGKRLVKTQQSDITGGIEREVKVYDAIGNEIATYKGKFDIQYDSNRILFDDEKGLRHIIYYPTGTIIIDEIEED